MCTSKTVQLLSAWCLLSNAIHAATLTKEETFDLTVVHVNDLHCHFAKHNFLQDTCPDNSDSPCYGGYDAIKALFNNIRQKENNVVNLNAGDNLDIHNTRWCGHYNSTVATHFGNKMEWDAVVMGNHEMDIDERHTEQYLRDANFTVLAANMVAGNNSDMKERFQPYTILERSGRKIGVIGYVINVTCYYEYWSNWWLVPPKHVTFGCQTHAVHKVAEELTRQGVDIIIALGHTGYIEYDLELARSVPNIDLVVGGHSHTFLWDGQWVASPSDAEEYVRGSYPHVVENELTGQKVLVVHCYKWGKYACELNLRFNEDGIPVEWSGVPHLLSEDSPRDSALANELSEWEKELPKVWKRPQSLPWGPYPKDPICYC